MPRFLLVYLPLSISLNELQVSKQSQDASDYITSGSEMEGEDIPLSGDEEEDTDDETDGLSGKDSDDADF